MGEHILQINGADGCVYLFNADTKKLSKMYEITKTKDVPRDVQETLYRAGLKADLADDTNTQCLTDDEIDGLLKVMEAYNDKAI